MTPMSRQELGYNELDYNGLAYDGTSRTTIGRITGRGRTLTPKNAFVLAAGLGTRMRPHNGHLPKPLVTVRGKSLIDYGLDRLAEAGIEQAVVNVHHLADALEQHLAKRT